MKNIQSVCEPLLKPVKIVEGIVEKRQTLPILNNILIEQNGESVRFSATDLDIQISTEAPVGVAGRRHALHGQRRQACKHSDGAPRLQRSEL